MKLELYLDGNLIAAFVNTPTEDWDKQEKLRKVKEFLLFLAASHPPIRQEIHTWISLHL